MMVIPMLMYENGTSTLYKKKNNNFKIEILRWHSEDCFVPIPENNENRKIVIHNVTKL